MIDNDTLSDTVARSLATLTGKRFTTLSHAVSESKTVQISWFAPNGASPDSVSSDVILSFMAGRNFDDKSYGVQVSGDGERGTVYITRLS